MNTDDVNVNGFYLIFLKVLTPLYHDQSNNATFILRAKLNVTF